MLASKFQPLKERFQQLAPREQKAVIIGGLFVVLFIVYQFIWTPLNEHSDYLRKQIITQQKTLQVMQETDKNIASAENNKTAVKAAAITPVALLSVLQQDLKKYKLAGAIKELKQTSNDTVSLNLSKVSFDAMMRLLLELQSKQKVTITQMSVTAVGMQGGVDMMIVFKC